MTAENTVAVSSVTEALVAARQAQKAGRVIPIAPCVQVDAAGKTVTCPKLDQTLWTLCKEPDGVLPIPGGVECPRQYGRLVLRLSASSNESPVNRSPIPLSLPRKKRRPYFVQ